MDRMLSPLVRSRAFLSCSAVFCLSALATLVPGCAEEAQDSAIAPVSTENDYTAKKGKLQLLVTVDWEGTDLTDENLGAMQDLHAAFPQVKLLHFLNAAYYTKPGVTATEVTARIKRVVAPNDATGLHIHGWKRLFEASGATFVNSPSFWGTAISERECRVDCGHEVPISLYPTSELQKVVRFSLNTLVGQGFGRATSFRCGGWMATQSVRDAIAAEGFTEDHSAVPTPFLQPQLGTTPLYTWLSDMWTGITPASQPFTLHAEAHDLLEVPDNGALADYVSSQQMMDTFETNKTAWQHDRTNNFVVSIGFHQETAAANLPALRGALTKIYAKVASEHLPLESVTRILIAPSSP